MSWKQIHRGDHCTWFKNNSPENNQLRWNWSQAASVSLKQEMEHVSARFAQNKRAVIKYRPPEGIDWQPEDLIDFTMKLETKNESLHSFIGRVQHRLPAVRSLVLVSAPLGSPPSTHFFHETLTRVVRFNVTNLQDFPYFTNIITWRVKSGLNMQIDT